MRRVIASPSLVSSSVARHSIIAPLASAMRTTGNSFIVIAIVIYDRVLNNAVYINMNHRCSCHVTACIRRENIEP
jgi:hypothetical protein